VGIVTINYWTQICICVWYMFSDISPTVWRRPLAVHLRGNYDGGWCGRRGAEGSPRGRRRSPAGASSDPGGATVFSFSLFVFKSCSRSANPLYALHRITTIYIYRERERDVYISVFIYIYIYIYVCIYIYIYVYICVCVYGVRKALGLFLRTCVLYMFGHSIPHNGFHKVARATEGCPALLSCCLGKPLCQLMHPRSLLHPAAEFSFSLSLSLSPSKGPYMERIKFANVTVNIC